MPPCSCRSSPATDDVEVALNLPVPAPHSERSRTVLPRPLVVVRELREHERPRSDEVPLWWLKRDPFVRGFVAGICVAVIGTVVMFLGVHLC